MSTTCQRLLCLLTCLGVLYGCNAPSDSGVAPAAQPRVEAAVLETSFAVGSTSLFIHDQSRPFDAVAGVESGVRTLITEIWYPVDHSNISQASVPATYGDYVFGNRTVHHMMMTQTTFFHLTPQSVREGVSQAQIDGAIDELFARKRGSYLHVPVAAPGPWPVIVMTHGDAGSRYNMQTVCEYLASHGYIVIAPDHTGNSPYAMIGSDPALAVQGGDPALTTKMAEVLSLLDENGAYGDPATFGQSYSPLTNGFSIEGFPDLDRSLVERVNDLRAALDTLEQLNLKGQFAGKIDLSRVGLMGRSFGAATTLAGLALEDRFIAGFAVAPPSLPDLRPALPPSALVSPPAESVLLSSSGNSALAEIHKPTLLLLGGEDHLILGLSAQMAAAMGGAAPSPGNPYPALQTAVERATVPVVYALTQNTNHGSFGVSGPYWWPELKPDTFPKFFNPEESYQLLDTKNAHKLQKEMALAYFDLMIRGDQSALEMLSDNPWKAYDTRVQIRGFKN